MVESRFSFLAKKSCSLRLSAMAARVSASSPCTWSLAKDCSSNLTLKERCSLLKSVICNRNWCLRHVHDSSISVSAASFWTRTIDCCGDLNATLMHWEVHFWSCSAYDIRILLLLLISSIAAGVTEQIPWETDNIFAGKCWSLQQNREDLLQKQLKREERFIIRTDRFLKSISSALSLTHLPLHHRLILKTLHSRASEDDDEDSKNLLETETISFTWSEDSRIPVLHRTDFLLLTGMREEIGKKKCAASAAAILDKNGFQLCSWCIMES